MPQLHKRKLNFVYGAIFLVLAALSLKSVPVIIAANTNADPDVSTRDVGMAWLKLALLPLSLSVSYAFFKHYAMTYLFIFLSTLIGFMVTVALFFITVADDNRSDLVKVQLLGLVTVASAVAIVDSFIQLIKIDRAEKLASQKNGASTELNNLKQA